MLQSPLWFGVAELCMIWGESSFFKKMGITKKKNLIKLFSNMAIFVVVVVVAYFLSGRAQHYGLSAVPDL